MSNFITSTNDLPRVVLFDRVIKLSHASVHYTDHASDPTEQCHLCEHFLGVDGGCDLVEGTISPQGWCEEFQAR